MSNRSNHLLRVLGLALACLALALPAWAQTRIKDVATIQGARDNQLVGYGIVVGLAGNGDSNSLLTKQSIANMVQRFGLSLPPLEVKSKNAAIVMITARIPAFARNGSKLDVTVSSLLDAKSLVGGTLLQTPLYGADRKVYAVAQGQILVGGFFAGTEGAGGASVGKNHPTNAVVPGGGLVEREIPTDLFPRGTLEIALREPDFTSAFRMSQAINEALGPIAVADSSTTVRVFVPEEAQAPERHIEFVARVENIRFKTDTAARIVINEKTGTVVANANIRIDPVAVAHGNLTISIVRSQAVSQPNPFTGNTVASPSASVFANAGGGPPLPMKIGDNFVYEDNRKNQIQLPSDVEPPAGFHLKMVPGTGGTPLEDSAGGTRGAAGPQTVVTDQTTTQVEEEKSSLMVLNDMPSVVEVAKALNALGVTPRDMMTIFQTMKQAGALQAELILQ